MKTNPLKVKVSHRILAIFLTVTFLPSIIPINFLYASGSGPTAPEASSFEPVDANDMVNLATGDLSYVMPLLNVPSPEGGYPLALSYHAGIALDQEASWVGLGWNINPGAVSRNVIGVPDDWLTTKKYTMNYDNIGVAKSISVGATAYTPIGTFGSNFNYTSFKATGGSTTHNFDYSTRASITGLGSTRISVGTSGVGLSAGLNHSKLGNLGKVGSLGFSINQSFRGGGLKGGIYTSIGSLGLGVRTDLSSRGELTNSLTAAGSSVNLGGGSSGLSSGVHKNSSGFSFRFPIPNPTGILTVDFGYSKKRYWAFDANYSLYNGALYSGSVSQLRNATIDPTLIGNDAYEAIYKSDAGYQQTESNFSFMSYDSYNVSGQGIGGTISPKILEMGTLLMPRNTNRTITSSSGRFHTPVGLTTYIQPGTDNNQKNFSKSIADQSMHFYFENEYSSFLKITSDNWALPSTNINYEDITQFSTINNTFDDISIIEGTSYDSYNEQNHRLKKGRFIETFTNAEIREAAYPLVIEPTASGFDRLFHSIPEDGIGAYKITDVDGKTYHYSLPVYQKEEFQRVFDVDDDIDQKFLEEQQFEYYATHWLLTAITGHDYIDTNGNGRLDDEDYGYWVEFEYGKWSDGFAWKSPREGYRTNGDSNILKWGIKEVYYLDKVKTRTHTALFIKEPRLDNKSFAYQIGTANNPRHYYFPFENGVFEDADGNYNSQGPHLDVPIFSYPPTNFFSESNFWIHADVQEHQSLRLDKILLLRNEDAQEISKFTNTDPNPTTVGRVYANARIRLISINGQLIRSVEEPIAEDHSYLGEFYGRVLNTSDVDLNILMPKAVKAINFDYDESYPLGKSTGASHGKLTLDKITFLGKQGTQVIPPYRFDYNNKTTTYTMDNMDDWGYYKNQAMVWSLDKITTPLGSSIDVTYENDAYSLEYAAPTTFFETGLEFKFTGTSQTQKTLMFRNDPDRDIKHKIDFRDYFSVGETTEIDVQYAQNTDRNGDNDWNADFATNCVVSTVSENLLVFDLPQTVNTPRERLNETCFEKNRVFYDNEYHHIRDETVNWHVAINENSCERPTRGTRKAKYKIFAQKEPLSSAQGGGIRVKEITATSLDASTSTMVYSYLNPISGEESGVTSFAPSTKNRVIPYSSEMPGPSVIYEYVTQEDRDELNRLFVKKTYHFTVPKTIRQTLEGGVEVENAFELVRVQGDIVPSISIDGNDATATFSKFKIIDHSASIGRLISLEEYNANNDLINRMENSYLPSGYDHKQGILEETFNTYKRVSNFPLKKNYIMTSSSKVKVPSVLSNSITYSNGVSQMNTNLAFDFLTGEVVNSSVTQSDGSELNTIMVPAYTKYPVLGSKAIDITYSNMLSQKSLNIVKRRVGNTDKIISTSINTWKPKAYSYQEQPKPFTINDGPIWRTKNVWRPHKNFVWDGEISADGTFIGYDGDDDSFDWSLPNATQGSQWLEVSEVTRYDDWSNPLEIKDINGSYSSTKMGNANEKVFATGNAGYNEIFYSGAEDDDGTGNLGGGVRRGIVALSNQAHTGLYSLNITDNSEAYQVFVNNPEGESKNFKVSVWARKGNHENLRLVVGTEQVEPSNNETVFAGNWVQLNFYKDISSGSKVHITSIGGAVLVDDFRLCPTDRTMVSYVYNEWDELTHILGANNMALKYQYDEAGRLAQVLTEVQDYNGVSSGGFKETNKYRYTYKIPMNP